jgi:hypothetical protein
MPLIATHAGNCGNCQMIFRASCTGSTTVAPMGFVALRGHPSGFAQAHHSASRRCCTWFLAIASARAFGPHLRPQAVDDREAAGPLDVPEGPAIAGFKPLGERTDAVDRADRAQ